MKKQERLYGKATNALRGGNWIKAFNILLEILHIDSKHFPSIKLIATILHGKNNYSLAKQYIDKGLVLSPGDIDLNFMLGSIYLQKGEYELALNVFSDIEIENDLTSGLALNIALAYRGLKDYDNALDYLRIAIDLDPTFLQALSLYATISIEINDFQEAEYMLKRIMKLYPNYYVAFYIMGVLCNKRSEWEKAIEYLDRAEGKKGVAIDEVWREMAWAWNMLGNGEKAETYLKHALEYNPTNIYARLDLGVIYMMQMNFKDALKEWSVVEKAAPDNPNVRKIISNFKMLLKGEGNYSDRKTAFLRDFISYLS